MNTASNILFTCGGKWVGHVLQLKEAMRAVPPLSEGRLFVADCARWTPAGHYADGAFVVPPIADPRYVDSLVDLCRREAIRVLLPLIDVDVLRLSPHRERFAEAGTTLIAPPPDLAERCFDKSAFDVFAAARGIPVPRSFTPDQLDGAPYPLFFKPARGFGSIGSGVCDGPAAARKALDVNPHLVFQEYLRGDEVSVDAYLASSGKCIVRVQRIRDKVVGGEAYQSHTVRLPKVRDIACRTLGPLAAAGLRGPVNVQIILADRPAVIDVNPRLGSAVLLSNVATGGRLFASLLAEACGLVCDGDPEDYREGIHLCRFLGDLFHDRSRPLAAFPLPYAA